MVSNQLRILEALYPEEAESLAVQREANERDYEYVYDINSPIDTDTMDESECREVWDTLDMFRAIDNSIRKLNTDAFNTTRASSSPATTETMKPSSWHSPPTP